MSDLKIVVPGQLFLAEISTAQVPILLGAGGLFANSGNVCTITFNAAHGLTFNPAAATAPNYFIQFSGVTAQTGVGTLNGPIFRILSFIVLGAILVGISFAYTRYREVLKTYL